LQGLGNVNASLPPLPEYATIKAERKRKREADEAAHKKHHLERKKEKKKARLARTGPGSISPSNDMEDMTSTAFGGVELPTCTSTIGSIQAVGFLHPRRFG
jgi:hypothetical protein